jgi:glycosyltransferase involved in cell wall biosynthesis
MRVLYLLPAAGFGGAERQGLAHIRHLARHGIEVVPVVGPGLIVPRALASDGMLDTVFLPQMPEDVSSSLRNWPAFVARWRSTKNALARIVRERAIDIIFASRSVAWIVASPVARRFELPMVWRGGSRLTRWLERVALRVLTPHYQPALFVANCAAVAADFAPYVSNVDVLANTIDTTLFDPRRIKAEREARGTLVGLAARPAPGKGLELLVEIVARVARHEPAVRFAIAGDFASRRRYEHMFAEAGVGDRVTFLGHVTDMPAFYAQCDVIVLTSDERSIEGSPNALLEAMAMERAIVATRVGGVPELVEDGEHGLLVQPGDAAGFAHSLMTLVHNEVQRRYLGAAARARVLANHGIDAIVSRLAMLLRDARERYGAHVRSAPASGAAKVAYGDR